MARVSSLSFERAEGQLHPTEVVARVKSFGDGANGPIVQIDTFGSEERQFHGKLSQTIQFDRISGLQLLDILQREYGPNASQ